MSTKTVRRIFIFFLIFLPLQYIAVGIIGYYKSEPWPAFVFPGFKSIYVYNGQYVISHTYFDVYDSEQEKIDRFKPYQFFPELPRSQISGFMRVHFQDSASVENLSSEARNWLYQNSREITGRPTERVEIISNVEFYRRSRTGLMLDSLDHQFTAVIQFKDL